MVKQNKTKKSSPKQNRKKPPGLRVRNDQFLLSINECRQSQERLPSLCLMACGVNDHREAPHGFVTLAKFSYGKNKKKPNNNAQSGISGIQQEEAVGSEWLTGVLSGISQNLAPDSSTPPTTDASLSVCAFKGKTSNFTIYHHNFARHINYSQWGKI